MFFGERIKQLREQKGLLQRQLAASLEMDTPMFSKIERGERKAKREQVMKLAKLLSVPSDELITLWLATQMHEMIKGERLAKPAIDALIHELNYKQTQQN